MNNLNILGENWVDSANELESAIRTHKDVYLIKIGKKNYIVKKISQDEVNVLEFLKPFKNVLQPIELKKEGEFYWAVYPKLETVLWGERNKEVYLTVMRVLAQFHVYGQENEHKLSFKSVNYQEDLSKIKQLYIQNDLPIGIFLKIEELVNELHGQKSLIHNDFLPFNILIDSDNNPQMIDFENYSLDFCERDLGRFISDINTFQGTLDSTHGLYYPNQFYTLLKEEYLSERLRLDSTYNVGFGRRRILLAEIWNHLIVTEVLIEKNDITCDWFELNYQALKRLTI